MKTNMLCALLICISLTAKNQTIEATSATANVSIGKWKNANAEVDKDIPVAKEKNENIYALIIGNEDYSKRQTGLNTEINVDFAENDAQMFKEYMIKTLGAPEKQVDMKINATYTEMKQGLSKLLKFVEFKEGEAQIFFYYSGHGLPDEATKEGYLIPVDVDAADVTNGIKIDDVYAQLTKFPSARVTVLLDACFSGGARNKGLVAMKGVKVNAKGSELSGNMVVMTSSSGQESSAVYRPKGHGYFTYFVLKSLQDSKGDITYKELFDYVKKNVSKEALLQETKTQNPQALISSSVSGQWQDWKFKE